MNELRVYTGVMKVDFDDEMILRYHEPIMISMLEMNILRCYAASPKARSAVIDAFRTADHLRMTRMYYQYRLGVKMYGDGEFIYPEQWWGYVVDRYREKAIIREDHLLPVLDI